jgi:hypothetical protein
VIVDARTATLRIDDREVALDTPRVIAKDEAVAQLPDTTKLPPAWVGVNECLRMDIAA